METARTVQAMAYVRSSIANVMISSSNGACSLVALQRVCLVEKKLFVTRPQFGTKIAESILYASIRCCSFEAIAIREDEMIAWKTAENP